MAPFEIRARYPFRFWFSIAVLVALPFLAAWLGLSTDAWLEAPLFVLGLAVFPVALLALFLATSPRAFQFDEDGFTVTRYAFPPRRFAYSDIRDFGTTTVRTHRGRVLIANMVNAVEVTVTFRRLVEGGSITASLEGRLAAQEQASAAGALAGSGAVGALAVYWIITGSTPARAGLWALAVFACVCGVAYAVSHIRSTNARAS